MNSKILELISVRPSSQCLNQAKFKILHGLKKFSIKQEIVENSFTRSLVHNNLVWLCLDSRSMISFTSNTYDITEHKATGVLLGLVMGRLRRVAPIPTLSHLYKPNFILIPIKNLNGLRWGGYKNFPYPPSPFIYIFFIIKIFNYIKNKPIL